MDIKRIEYEDLDENKVKSYVKKMDSIFASNGQIDKMAYMNWRISFCHSSRRQFVIIGEAFFATGYNMLQQCLDDNTDKKADSWIFPILFNVVHGIEVYLKAINASLNAVLAKPNTEIEGGHNIKQLCEVARSLIIEYKSTEKNDTTNQMFEAIKIVQNFISNIYEKTHDMTFARYPMDKDKEDHFYVLNTDNEVVDLVLLKEQMHLVYKMLEFLFETSEMVLEIQAEV